MSTRAEARAKMEARCALTLTPVLCEGLEMLEAKPALDDAERFTRMVLIDVLCQRHPEAEAAFAAWADDDGSDPRDAVPAITTAARTAALLAPRN